MSAPDMSRSDTAAFLAAHRLLMDKKRNGEPLWFCECNIMHSLAFFSAEEYEAHLAAELIARDRDIAGAYGLNLIEQPCSQGCCVELIEPATGENAGGWGPVGCACQEAVR